MRGGIMSVLTARRRDRSARWLRDDLGEPFHLHLTAAAGGATCAAGLWLLLYAFGLLVELTPIAGLVASAAGGALGMIGGQLLRGRPAGAGDAQATDRAARGATAVSDDRDVAIDEVWRELSQLRRELRQAVGHGASKVAR
jgi:hypothetical protein